MAISERELHPYIKTLVEEYGELNVTELTIKLREILDLDKEDRQILSNRKDDKFSQKVRNIVSHSAIDFNDKNGYILEKNIKGKKSAIFYAKEKSNIKLEKQNIIIRQKKKNQFNTRKVNFEDINRKKTVLGLSGEMFALKWEQDRLKNLNVEFDILEEVVHVSKVYGDGAGYDILSKQNNNYKPLYIEVKATKKGLDTPFFMSENEKLFMEIYKEEAIIYRVYNYNENLQIGDIETITYEQLFIEKKYIFDPITYRVSKKTKN